MKALNVSRPRAYDANDPRYFVLRSGAVRAYKRVAKAADGSEVTRYLIEGTASSSVEDRYGDTLTEACQASMLAQANDLTMWLNHSYNVPEDIAGTCIEPTLERATAEDGTSCLDLKITLEIDAENPRASKAWQHVNAGTRLAFSIGGYFKEVELVYDDDDDWWGHLIVDDIELLEISLVGIPANPRAYTKTFDAIRAAIVKRAEEIVIEARSSHLSEPQMRTLVCKSFGLSAEEELPVNKCTHADGCENEKAEGSEFCKDHMPAPVVESPKVPVARTPGTEPTVKAVDDPGQQTQVVGAMKCIKNCIEAPGHALCAEPMAHASAAHAILKAMLPDDYGLPTDAQISAPPPAVAAALEIKVLTTERDELKSKLAAAETQIAELKATPTGRQTRSTFPGGSSEGSEPTVDEKLYYENRTVLARRGAQKMDAAPDARQAVQVRT